MSYIEITDFLLLIFYLIFFTGISVFIAKKSIDSPLRKFFLLAFLLRMLGSVLYALVFQYYYGYGDTFTFFKGGMFFTDRIAEDISNLKYFFISGEEMEAWYSNSPDADPIFQGYFSHPSGNMIMKISAIFSYLSFKRYLIVSLFFGFFSFLGQWKLFEVFNELSTKKNSKFLALLVLYSPSIWFWGSGLIKDSICLGALGFVLFFLYKFIKKKDFDILSLVMLLFFAYIILVVKPYILVITLVCFTVSILIHQLNSIQNFLLKIGLFAFSIITAIFLVALIDFEPIIETFVTESTNQINLSIQNYELSALENSKGSINVAALDASLSGILLSAPGAIFRCLYRPFLWEGGSVMILLTSLESTFLFAFTLMLLFKTRIIGFFKIAFRDPYHTFCLLISLLFALIIGFTTFNFGTLVRYKVILLPFFYFLHIQIYHSLKNSEKKVP